jgi:hypothetical protein
MKLLFRSNVYGWRMTGILGNNAKWFIGLSRNVNEKQPAKPRHFKVTWSFPYKCPFCKKTIQSPSDNKYHGPGGCVKRQEAGR